MFAIVTIALAALLLEDNHLVAFQMIQNLSLNGAAGSRAELEITFVADHKHFLERNFIANITNETINENLLATAHFKLLTGYCYNRKHDVSKYLTIKHTLTTCKMQ